MLLDIARVILLFVALLFVVTVVSVAVWVVKDVIRWLLRERKKRK